MVGSTPIVSETNCKQIPNDKGVRTLILAVLQPRLTRFSTDRQKNPNSTKINQLRLRKAVVNETENRIRILQLQILVSVWISSVLETTAFYRF